MSWAELLTRAATVIVPAALAWVVGAKRARAELLDAITDQALDAELRRRNGRKKDASTE